MSKDGAGKVPLASGARGLSPLASRNSEPCVTSRLWRPATEPLDRAVVHRFPPFSRTMRRPFRFAPLLLIVFGLAPGCTTLQQLAALRQVDFDLDRVANGFVAGVDLDKHRGVAPCGRCRRRAHHGRRAPRQRAAPVHALRRRREPGRQPRRRPDSSRSTGRSSSTAPRPSRASTTTTASSSPARARCCPIGHRARPRPLLRQQRAATSSTSSATSRATAASRPSSGSRRGRPSTPPSARSATPARSPSSSPVGEPGRLSLWRQRPGASIRIEAEGWRPARRGEASCARGLEAAAAARARTVLW